MTRSLTVHSIRIHKRRKKDEAISPCDIDGRSIGDYLADFCRSCNYSSTRNEARKSMIACTNLSRVNGNALLMQLSHARWGEESDVLKPNDFSVVNYHIGEEDPTTGKTRAYMYIPERGDVALYFCEYAMRGSAGYDLLILFKRYLTSEAPIQLTVDINRVPSDEEWINNATLTELRIELRKQAQNREDGITGYQGRLSYVLVPDKLSSWPAFIKDKLLSRKQEGLIEVADRLDINVGTEEPKAIVTLQGDDGRKTTFSLGDDGEFRAPYIREVIEKPDGNAFSDEQFCSFCEERAGVILDKLGS